MTNIEWTEKTWNPIVGCSKISEGCRNCYAINQAYRNAAMGAKLENPGRLAYYKGLTEKKSDRVEWTGKANFVPEALEIPLKTKKPTTWFVNSMSDLFHESVSDEWIDQVFAVMALTPQHTYQVLTKRADRMLEYFDLYDVHGKTRSMRWKRINNRINDWLELNLKQIDRLTEQWGSDYPGYPYKNVWLGVTVENQKTANERIPLLLQTPAAVRWLSCEPLLGAINLAPSFVNVKCQRNTKTGAIRLVSIFEEEEIHRDAILTNYSQTSPNHRKPIDWVIAGGESGHNARPCKIEWIRSIVSQCKEAGVPVFVKQLGSNCHSNLFHPYKTKGKKGGDISEFPEDLRVREFPQQ